MLIPNQFFLMGCYMDKFKRIGNILYSDDYHLYSNEVMNFGCEKIGLNSDKGINNPKYLFVSLCCDDGNVSFGVYYDDIKFKWKFDDGYIMNKGKYLGVLDGKICMMDIGMRWIIDDKGMIMNVENGLYLDCDLHYNVILSDKGMKLWIDIDGIHYMKPKLRIDFEMHNIKNGININDVMVSDSGINVCILLAAGTSSRFGDKGIKQLYKVDGMPIIMYSINAIIEQVDEIVVVTNNMCFDEISLLVKGMDKVHVAVNNVNCRLESIGVGLDYIRGRDIRNVIVHDSARPFITKKCIGNLMGCDDMFLYSQYYLKLVNGLAKGNKMVDRGKYVEICTPFICNYGLFCFIFDNYIDGKNRIVHEVMPILNIMGIKYNLILGNSKELRKITYDYDV